MILFFCRTILKFLIFSKCSSKKKQDKIVRYFIFNIIIVLDEAKQWCLDKLLKDELLKDKLRKDKLLKDKLLTRQTPENTNS